MTIARVELRFAQEQYETLMRHLFPGDGCEHAAVMLATLVNRDGTSPRLLVREVLAAQDGVDYVTSPQGYGRLAPHFIHRAIVRARDERRVYLHVHNHPSDRSVDFSAVDLASHERGYPALLDIAGGPPVGAVVVGRRSMEIDLWWPVRSRSRLSRALVLGSSLIRLYASPEEAPRDEYRPDVDRQIRFLGIEGQAALRRSRVAVIGLGGVGSMVVEMLVRMGVGTLLLIDADCLEDTNLSRVVTAFKQDVRRRLHKANLAKRYARLVSPEATCEAIVDDVAYDTVADKLVACDFIFLCADTMRARLLVNAIVHQHFVPAVQVGTKILQSADRVRIEHFYSVVRDIRPGFGCLVCNGLISPTRLAIEEKSADEWRVQNYGTESPNPSVISLNGIGASRAVNDYLLNFIGTDIPRPGPGYFLFDVTKGNWARTHPRRDAECTECGARVDSRFAQGDRLSLPIRKRPIEEQP